MNRFMLCSVCMVALICQTSWADPWADTVVSYDAGDAADYTDASTVLGEPSRTTAAWPDGTESVRMTVSAWQASELLKIGDGGSLVVGFDEAVANDPLNPFGIDLLVFTNLSYASSDWPANQTIGSPLYAFGGAIGTISVSQDGIQWYQVTSTGPMFPTHAYLSAEAGAYLAGATPTDYTLPVDPSLAGDDFAGLTLTQALALYNGSGGGMGIDLSGLEGGTVDLDWIQYVKIDGATNALDGFADVSAVPEPATMLLLGGGLAALAARRRRTR